MDQISNVSSSCNSNSIGNNNRNNDNPCEKSKCKSIKEDSNQTFNTSQNATRHVSPTYSPGIAYSSRNLLTSPRSRVSSFNNNSNHINVNSNVNSKSHNVNAVTTNNTIIPPHTSIQVRNSHAHGNLYTNKFPTSQMRGGRGEFPFLPNLAAATPPCTPTQVPMLLSSHQPSPHSNSTNNNHIPNHDHTHGNTNNNSNNKRNTQALLFPPISHQREKAVEQAHAQERTRIQQLEAKETNMDEEGLRRALKRERMHSTRLAGEIAALKAEAVRSQAEAEVHEEGRINGLMRRLDCLQREKGRIIVELEREEEMLTNTLQKKLNEVRREKAHLERRIEKEHSNNTNLKAKLDNMEPLHSSDTTINHPNTILHSNSNQTTSFLDECTPTLYDDSNNAIMEE
eukprot:CAMPEP_0184869190 /NCGR_PEP_ID=MMETSP0580-20130426/33307_1 /TAXON_ID=1118495 /ORGANISM="Dactyliosolen fragilissimus" /LENGTH=397 /DNA_ID=CAMNT_0027370517 /DNA_START=22 /DNA_END=1215 /DNA_ORIENTATION=+